MKQRVEVVPEMDKRQMFFDWIKETSATLCDGIRPIATVGILKGVAL